MPSGQALALGASAGLGAFQSFFSGKEKKKAANQATNIQLQAQLRALRDLGQTYRGAQRELGILKTIGTRNLRRFESLSDPNSVESQQERERFGKVLSQNLAARGLTGSGAELAGLRDFEVDLAGQRRGQIGTLANVGVSTLNNLANLQSNFGQNQANIHLQGGANLANLAAGRGEASAAQLTGIGNAFQTGLLGLGQIQAQQQNQDFIRSLLGGGDTSNLNYRFR